MTAIKTLQARLERLERAVAPADVTVVMLVDFAGYGPLLRFRSDDGFCCERRAGEAEQDFSQRTEAEAKAYRRSHPARDNGFMVLFSERERLPDEKPQPQQRQPEPVPMPSVQPKPQPRLMSIQEVEGQYADRRHWMS